VVEVNRQGDDLRERFIGQRFDLRLLFGGDGVGEKLRRIMLDFRFSILDYRLGMPREIYFACD